MILIEARNRKKLPTYIENRKKKTTLLVRCIIKSIFFLFYIDKKTYKNIAKIRYLPSENPLKIQYSVIEYPLFLSDFRTNPNLTPNFDGLPSLVKKAILQR